MANPTKKTMTCDGNQVAAHIACMFSEVAATCPVTSSSTMAEHVDERVAARRRNIFGEIIEMQEMQSEAGTTGTMHGVLQAGALGVAFTASQGLLLVLPNMCKVAGELLPGIYHVAARTVASQALSIFGDHQDVMSTRMTGLAQLCADFVQEVMGLAAIAHLTAIKNRVPFIHFFDGFRTPHGIQKIGYLSNENLGSSIDQKALHRSREHVLSTHAPVVRDTIQNGDIFFQARRAFNPFYDAAPAITQDYMDQLAKITGHCCHLLDYYRDPEAEYAITAIGSTTEATRGSTDYLRTQGKKIGPVAVHLYRPFNVEHFLGALPKGVKRIAAFDRTKGPGAVGDPLHLDVKNALYMQPNAPSVVGGRYGLSSKDTMPAQITTISDNLAMNELKDQFTIGTADDVTFKSLLLSKGAGLENDAYEARFSGLGADGTVGANKNSVRIIGENTNKYCQAYFVYDSEKNGGFTTSHLHFGDQPIRSTYLVVRPSFIACHIPTYLRMYDVLAGPHRGGTFLLNSVWDLGSIEEHLSDHIKRYLAKNETSFYMINAIEIAQHIGLGNCADTILQSASSRTSGVIPYDLTVEQVEEFIVKSYSRKGGEIVNKNPAATDEGVNVIQVPVEAERANLPDKPAVEHAGDIGFVRNVVRVVNAQRGDSPPVSASAGRKDGTWDSGMADSERRGVSDLVPVWIENNYIQCDQCAFVCPHTTIRPFSLNEKKVQGTNVALLDATDKGFKEVGLKFRIQVNYLNCLGCSSCVNTCPDSKQGRAPEMVHPSEVRDKQCNWDYMYHQITNKSYMVDVQSNVENSQFAQPLFEYSGACSGCGETPHIKLLMQLFGTHQVAANAAGCSSIYSTSAPSTSYTTNDHGKGPVWASPLFEDNTEFGMGMYIVSSSSRSRLVYLVKEILEGGQEQPSNELRQLLNEWVEQRFGGDASQQLSYKILPLPNARAQGCMYYVYNLRHRFIEPSQWIIDGDGWAYDTGFDGLDHILTLGKNVNVFMLDTEVYSNAGGQSSKSIPLGAIARLAAADKRVRKKDLGPIATIYGYVYVAQIVMGVNPTQTFKVPREAEAYEGPPFAITYSPYILHGLKDGIGSTRNKQKRAVECGRWYLWYRDPRREQESKNPFVLDSKEPDFTKFKDFLKGEVRYVSLFKMYPDIAEELANEPLRSAYRCYSTYMRISSAKWENDYGPLADILDAKPKSTIPEEAYAVNLTQPV